MKKRTFLKSIFDQEVVCWKKIGNHNCIYVTLSKHVTKEAVEDINNTFVELVLKSNQDKVIMVWNASLMKSYDPEAGIYCQKQLKVHSDITDSVWVISTSVFVFGITEIVSFFSSRTIKMVKNLQELDKKLLGYQKK